MTLFTIANVNNLAAPEKREIYSRMIPSELFERFALPANLVDAQGHDLLQLHSYTNTSSTEMAVYHRFAFSDPILFGHISDTINGQIHVLLYILNDPTSPRFEVDCLPNGVPTQFGTQHRNLPAEMAAMEYGLAPGQIRRGLRMLGSAIKSFEAFVASLGHEVYFAEPLHYHNAILFEKYGFAYEKGRRLMNRIQAGFGECGDLHATLDSSTPFRHPEAAHSIRLRSWAIHDGILGEPFNNVTMYKWIGKSAGIDSCPRLAW